MKTKIALYSSYSSNSFEEFKHLEDDEFEFVQIDSNIKIVVLDDKNFKMQLKRVAKLNLDMVRGSNFIVGVVLKISNGKLRMMLQEILANYVYVSDVVNIKEFDKSLMVKYREIEKATNSIKKKRVVLYQLMKFQAPVSTRCCSVAKVDSIQDFLRLVEVSESLVVYLDPTTLEESDLLIIQSFIDKEHIRYVEKPERYQEVYGTYDPLPSM